MLLCMLRTTSRVLPEMTAKRPNQMKARMANEGVLKIITNDKKSKYVRIM